MVTTDEIAAVPLFAELPDADLEKKSDKLLNEFADGLLLQNPNSSEARPRFARSFGGNEAMDVCLELDDDRFLQARIVLANKKAYIVSVTGPGQPDGSPWVQEFLDAFQPGVENAKPKAKDGKNPFRGK